MKNKIKKYVYENNGKISEHLYKLTDSITYKFLGTREVELDVEEEVRRPLEYWLHQNDDGKIIVIDYMQRGFVSSEYDTHVVQVLPNHKLLSRSDVEKQLFIFFGIADGVEFLNEVFCEQK